ncbi:COQ9 family ubiquinone biosynthesis protein [Oceanicola sp. 22II-s10i]|uniref:COQ9 family protein n=1 Tax=Oceanicola sp. 22II-s10i TaxID=1317116 RepID=UPI000B522F2C|nr:COQ9 family protein [Oceanicola sp. 22II-s10i]OWU86588.1 COQ9 family ubiquinone biosynthesis protein [Oceanicola sp. 22II-s10i]
MTGTTDTADKLLDAALAHVPFDGWSAGTLKAAAEDSGVDYGLAQALFPRGAVDLALAFHKRGDAEMVRRMQEADLSSLRYSERVAQAIRFRLDAVPDKELVRRGMTLFALPQNAGDGAKALWGTADAIWRALGDTSDDVNWYTKRATLSGVYGSVVLYWLGDDSPGHHATSEFIDRRIDDVMRIEKAKAAVRENKLASAVLAGPMALMGMIRAPKGRPEDMPGHMG